LKLRPSTERPYRRAGDLANAIKRDFGSFENMLQQLSAQSVGIQGSGWGWLGYNKQFNRLEIATCGNQDPLLATTGQKCY
jgi:Fe-Mn family superoxide dismutase